MISPVKDSNNMEPRRFAVFRTVLFTLIVAFSGSLAQAASLEDLSMEDLWKVSQGGRLYDNWFAQLLINSPPMQHPSYPSDGLAQLERTWRCVECHGWDFKGRDVTESGKPPMPGITQAQKYSNSQILRILRNNTHRYTSQLIPDEQAENLAMFIRFGIDDFKDVVARDGSNQGNPERGQRLFNFTCRRCHGKEGTNINLGSKRRPRYIGTYSHTDPQLLLHKIRYGQPGVGMLSFGEFVERVLTGELINKQDLVDVLSYAQTLPTE